jgi:adenosylmethionine-8-amino-7-oxononanoate aminotransferase
MNRFSGSRLARWDKRHIWHPFTQHTEWESREPFVVESGDGVWIRDQNGRRVIDGVSSLWVNVWGHHRKELDQAIIRQLKKISHCTFLGLSHEPAILLARRLLEIAPRGLTRVFYSDNGSTAVEVALKMAYQYWQLQLISSPLEGEDGGGGDVSMKTRTPHPILPPQGGKAYKSKFVSLKEGYHGDTLGSVSVGGVDMFHERFRGLLFKGFQVKPGDSREIEKVLKNHHREIAAVVMEPLIQGASGMLVMPKGYLRHVARLCRKYNVLLIVDEVATGFGRTGTMFACEQEGVSPDLLCIAKSVTGGYLPLAATLTSEKIYRAFLGKFDEFKHFFHGHTYTANPLACAVALANLELYRKEKLLHKIRQRTKELAAGLEPLKAHPHVKEIRQVGLMAGIELIKDKKRGIPYEPGKRMGMAVCDAALQKGVWLRPLGDVIVIMPPLAISAKELQIVIRAVTEAIREITA